MNMKRISTAKQVNVFRSIMYNIIIMSFLIEWYGGCYSISYDLDTEVLCCEIWIIFMENGRVSYDSEKVGFPCKNNDGLESVNEVNDNNLAVVWILVLFINFSMGFICYPLVIFLIITSFY